MEADRPGLPSRNPVPLSASQEQEVKKLYYKRVRGYCGDEIKAFAQCAKGRTISLAWNCRELRQAMNGCMLAHASQDEEDRAREQWFRERQQKEQKA